jgi:hypothetical protein
MQRFRGGLSAATVLVLVAAVSSTGAQAKIKHRHAHGYVGPVAHRPVDFPVYIDHGSDRNPGTDNLYFTDTRNPSYELGPTIFQKYEDK